MFKDELVEAICATKFGDKKGTTEDDAFIVTKITSASGFAGQAITSFDELAYFVNLDTIDGAFQDCSSLTSVTIPAKTTRLLNGAFKGCANLTSVTFPENSELTEVGNNAFYFCKSLTSLELPDTVTTLGRFSLYCPNLKKFVLPRRVSSFNMSEVCRGLPIEELHVNGDNVSLTLVDSSSGTNAVLKEIYYDGVLTETTESMFAGCTALESFILGNPNALESIGKYTFSACVNLRFIDLSSWRNLTTIGEYAFNQCLTLGYIFMPPSVRTIYGSSFVNCPNVNYVFFGEHEWVPTIEKRSALWPGVPSNATVVVPDKLYDEWIIHSKWSEIADRIIKMSDYQG